MQDIHSVGGGRFFGGSGGPDRRLRPQQQHPSQQALKCPRCDSINTKFCYYNNYNLSQPRHFCKSCRRYWTKGGVLRNVPVGGGCRKTKRSKAKPSSPSSPPPPPPQQPNITDQRKASSHSSSESSSLTNTTTTTAAAATATEAVSAQSSSLLGNIHHQDSKFFVSQSVGNGAFQAGGAETALLEQGTEINGMFSEIGSFTSLITASNDVTFSFGNIAAAADASVSPFRLSQQSQAHHHHHHQVKPNQWGQQGQELKMQEVSGGLLDQTAQVDLSVFNGRSNGEGGGFGSLDWQPGSGDQGLFDLPNSVDQAYWSQSQWTDQDHPTLYLP